jgi:hypothetical protein
MKSLTYALIAVAAVAATAGCSIRTREVASTTPPATTVIVPSQPSVAVTPAPAPVMVAPSPSAAPGAVVVTPAPAPVVVAPAPAATVVAPVTVYDWCGGAYAPSAGTSFGSCPR